MLGVIPARLSSARLPEKPLHPILGRPLVEWVWRRAAAMRVLDRVVVATDDDRVAEVCRRAGAETVLTSPDHPSGTDRAWEVADREENQRFGIVVNLQGDEPLVEESHVEAAVALVRDQGWGIGTCAAPLGSELAYRSPNVVKVVRGSDGSALYFSRAPIPHLRDRNPGDEELAGDRFLRHLGVYAYAREALERWVGRNPSPLEEIERLEQLRALEGGERIGVAVVEGAEPGVDTLEDARAVERRMRALGLSSEDRE